MAERPVLSIMTPIYNGEDFIARSYFMLHTQTFTAWEWVVVNDGSTDRTEECIKAIADARIRFISYERNRGRGYARRRALEAAQGDWLVVWDVDDIYFPDRLAKVNQARLDGYDFCCSYAVLVDNDLNITGYRGFTRDDFGLTRTFIHASAGFEIGLARSVGYDPDLPAGEDAALILFLSQSGRGQWLQEPLFAYQQLLDVNIHKAIVSNRSRLRGYRRLYRKDILHIDHATYLKMELKLRMKLALLSLFRFWPSLYPQTVRFRSSGAIDRDWQLAAERREFLETIRQRQRRNDWAVFRA